MQKPKDEQQEAPEAAPPPDAAGTEGAARDAPGREIGGADGIPFDENELGSEFIIERATFFYDVFPDYGSRQNRRRTLRRPRSKSAAPRARSRPATVTGNATGGARISDAPRVDLPAHRQRRAAAPLTCTAAGKPSNFVARRDSAPLGDRRKR